MVSVRATVEPLSAALGNSPIILLQASFVGLPVINQKLTMPPVSLRNLLEVISTTPIQTVLDALKQAQAGQQLPPRPPQGSGGATLVPPVIDSAAKTASGQYEVKGKKFLASHAVHIRVVNAGTLQSNVYQATSDSAGNLDALITVPSLPAGTRLAFSANDERLNPADLTGTLWSNTVTITV